MSNVHPNNTPKFPSPEDRASCIMETARDGKNPLTESQHKKLLWLLRHLEDVPINSCILSFVVQVSGAPNYAGEPFIYEIDKYGNLEKKL